MADEQENTAPAEPEEEAPGGISVEIAPNPQAPRMSDEDVERLSAGPKEDELKNYTKAAQNQIKMLRAAFAEQRRRADQFQQDASTAQGFAQQLYQENERLKVNVNRSESALIDQALARAESQVENAKQQVRAAHTSSDADQITVAHEALARSVAEVDRLKLLKPAAAEAGAAGTVPAPASQPAPQLPQRRPPSARTERWVQEHPWFGYGPDQDHELTDYALFLHRTLERAGVDEAQQPELYWRTLEERLAKAYPNKFQISRPPEGRAAPTRPAPVTGSQRTNGSPERSGRRIVQLSESELRLARSLGVTPEQYAVEKLKKEEEERRKVQ